MDQYILRLLNFTKSYALFKLLYGGIGTILAFHRVNKNNKNGNYKLLNNKQLEIKSNYLEGCIKYFKERNYGFGSIEELYQILQGNKRNRKIVVFTFDDGYVDIHNVIYPLLKKYNIPFTLYLSTGFPDKTVILWWYLLEDLLTANDNIVFQIGNKEISLRCGTQIEKEIAFKKLSNIIMNSNHKDYLENLKQIFEPYKIELFQKTAELALSWDQIIKLSKDPIVTIAAHTVNHLVLNKLSPVKIKEEVINSKAKLESKLGKLIDHFAYPYGGKTTVGPREFAIVKECGFKTATTTRTGNIFLEHGKHINCLPRIAVEGDRQDIKYLNLMVNGIIPAKINNFKRVVTI